MPLILKVSLGEATSRNDFQFKIYLLEWVELEDTYQLSAVSTLQDAVHTIIKFLGLGPANATEKVPEGTHTHTLLCSGEFGDLI